MTNTHLNTGICYNTSIIASSNVANVLHFLIKQLKTFFLSDTTFQRTSLYAGNERTTPIYSLLKSRSEVIVHLNHSLFFFFFCNMHIICIISLYALPFIITIMPVWNTIFWKVIGRLHIVRDPILKPYLSLTTFLLLTVSIHHANESGCHHGHPEPGGTIVRPGGPCSNYTSQKPRVHPSLPVTWNHLEALVKPCSKVTPPQEQGACHFPKTCAIWCL